MTENESTAWVRKEIHIFARVDESATARKGNAKGTPPEGRPALIPGTALGICSIPPYERYKELNRDTQTFPDIIENILLIDI